jgi:hypothetical protein
MGTQVFVIHSEVDAVFVEQLAARLRAADLEVWAGSERASVGDNVIDRVTRNFEDIQFVVAVISPGFIGSPWIAHEMSTWMLKEALGTRPVILTVISEECLFPSYLADHLCFDFRDAFDGPAESLIARMCCERPGGEADATARAGVLCRTVERQLDHVAEAFDRGTLVIFCGAGVSMSAGIPGWKVFLRGLLSDFFDKTGKSWTDQVQRSSSLAKVYQEYFDLSPIIVAQYLKNSLGRDFQRTVRDALYASDPKSSALIGAIGELCRPQRERRALSSIVNFNFDDLIEQTLEKNKIRHRAIFKEGQRPAASELPIYHVHGYLPRDVEPDATATADIVFSEDAYHSKFIDPFSWSNLTQLNQLHQSTCLFIGLGLTDPNLRRLLDVAMRKTPDKRINHVIFKKRYDVEDLARHMARWEELGPSEEHARKMVRMAEILEERDCNNLGLNVVWVDEFSDIPPLVSRIARE